jgi:hypothetical protein
MRKLLTALIPAAILAAGGLLAASQAPAGATGRAPMARSCNLANDRWQTSWGNKDLGTVAYLWIQWTANPCQQKAEVSADCHSFITGGNTHPTSGAVKAVNLKAEVDCPIAWPMLDGFRRLTNADGSWRAWVTVCAPCGGARPGAGGPAHKNQTPIPPLGQRP